MLHTKEGETLGHGRHHKRQGDDDHAGERNEPQGAYDIDGQRRTYGAVNQWNVENREGKSTQDIDGCWWYERVVFGVLDREQPNDCNEKDLGDRGSAGNKDGDHCVGHIFVMFYVFGGCGSVEVVLVLPVGGRWSGRWSGGRVSVGDVD